MLTPVLSLLEFRRHREVSNPVHIIGFLSQWKMYLDAIPSDNETAVQWKGKKLDPTVFEKASVRLHLYTDWAL